MLLPSWIVGVPSQCYCCYDAGSPLTPRSPLPVGKHMFDLPLIIVLLFPCSRACRSAPSCCRWQYRRFFRLGSPRCPHVARCGPQFPHDWREEQKRGIETSAACAESDDAHRLRQELSSDIITDKASECMLAPSLPEVVAEFDGVGEACMPEARIVA